MYTFLIDPSLILILAVYLS